MIADLIVDPRFHRVSGPGGTLQVDGRVAAILDVLASRKGEIVAKDQLVDTVWERQAVTDDAIAKGISRARSVLREAGLEAYRITNVRGVGYRLDTSEAALPNVVAVSQPWLQSAALFMVIIGLSQTMLPDWVTEASSPMTIQVGDGMITVLNPNDPKVRIIDPETGEAKHAREYPRADTR